MRYMLLINSDESVYPKMSEQEMGKIMADYEQFTNELHEAKAFLDAARLQSTTTATTVRIRKGEMLTTDGPFAETKEQFGGYYLIEAKDLDDAIHWAAKIPTAKYGSVEIRPVWE